MFQEVPTHIRRKENNGRKDHQEHGYPDQIFARVVRVECNSVDWLAVRVLVLLDIYAIRVVRADLVQRDDVDENQRYQD